MSDLRIGLVGTGGIGRTHIERINNTLQGGKVVACADPAGAFGLSVAEKFGIKRQTAMGLVKKLEQAGVNPVTLTNACEYEQMENLRNILKK